MSKILIIDDEFLIAKDIKMLLKVEKNIDSDTASNPNDAISLYKDFSYDLLICDINLNSDIDGIELVKKILEIRKVPIIFLTAYKDDILIERAKKTIPFAYLLKPFDENQLLLTVELSILNYKNSSPSENNSIELRNEFEKLTKREKEILSYVKNGMTSKEIGNTLHISSLTVDKHKKNMKKKLSLSTMAEMIKFALKVETIST